MKIHKIKTNRKIVWTVVSLALSAVALAACGTEGDVADLSAMTRDEQIQMERNLTEALEVDGVKLLTLYDNEEQEDVQQKFLAIAVTVEKNDGKAIGEMERSVSYDIYDLETGLPKKSTKPMQSISVEEYTGSDPLPCNIQDLNFDGAQDFSLWLWDGTQNVRGRFFLWEEEQNCFVENEELGQLDSPVIKKEEQIVQEHSYINEYEYTDNLYRWEGDQLVPVRRILQNKPNERSLQGEVYDWYEDYWEPMYERKILISAGEWNEADRAKARELTEEMEAYYDPEYI